MKQCDPLGIDLPKYGAVILYFRLGESVENTLSALNNQTHPPTEIVLVDNASGDGVVHGLVLEGRIDRSVRIVHLQDNHGYAGGMNRGIAALQVPTANVLLLTHEVLLEPTSAAVLSALSESESAVAVGPTLELPLGGTWSTGGFLTRTGRPDHRTDAIVGASRRVAWLDGACTMVKRSTLEQIGGLDESYFLYWEDVDLGTRLNAAGRVLCSSQAHALQSTASAPIYFDTRNRLRYWRKQGRFTVTLLSVAELLAKLLLRDLPGRSRERVAARLWGMIDGLGSGSRVRHNFVRENR